MKSLKTKIMRRSSIQSARRAHQIIARKTVRARARIMLNRRSVDGNHIWIASHLSVARLACGWMIIQRTLNAPPIQKMSLSTSLSAHAKLASRRPLALRHCFRRCPSDNPTLYSSADLTRHAHATLTQRHRWTSKRLRTWPWQRILGGVETSHVQYTHRNSAEWFVLKPDASSIQEFGIHSHRT